MSAEIFAIIMVTNMASAPDLKNESCRYNIDEEALYCTVIKSHNYYGYYYNVKFKGVKLPISKNKVFIRDYASYYPNRSNNGTCTYSESFDSLYCSYVDVYNNRGDKMGFHFENFSINRLFELSDFYYRQ